MPNAATEKLSKILKLETQTNYGDKAVTRGLQSFAPAWLGDAAKNNVDPAWAEIIAQHMRDYSALADVSARREKLDLLLTLLRTPVLQGQTAAAVAAPAAMPADGVQAAPRQEARRIGSPAARIRITMSSTLPAVGIVATRSSMSSGPNFLNLILPSCGLRRQPTPKHFPG